MMKVGSVRVDWVGTTHWVVERESEDERSVRVKFNRYLSVRAIMNVANVRVRLNR